MADVTRYKRDFLLKLLEQMITIRRFEEKAAQMYGLRKIGGFCHLYNGQEGVAVGSVAALDLKKDYILTSYRDHAHALVSGMPAKSIMAELYGKITGCSRGKGGSMHMFDVERHMFGGNGIVGSQIPIGAGIAFACKYRNDGGVVLCYFGDGAIHQGTFHEVMNLAAIWKLPLVMIVENNKFGMGTSVERISSVDDFDVKAQAYGLKGTSIDGMCAITVYEAIKKARKAARKGETQLLDIKTYRYKGHSMSDPGKYRTKQELEEYKQQDPIVMMKIDMQEANMLTDEEYSRLDAQVKQIVQESVEFAEASPEPGLETIYEDIFA